MRTESQCNTSMALRRLAWRRDRAGVRARSPQSPLALRKILWFGLIQSCHSVPHPGTPPSTTSFPRPDHTHMACDPNVDAKVLREAMK